MAVIAAVLVLAPNAALAQTPESIESILNRGHVRYWITTGPIEADVAGGIPGALQNRIAALGESDPLAETGGVRRVRPQDQASFGTPSGLRVTWEQRAALEVAVDLSNHFDEERSGIAFAAFYTRASRPQPVLLEVQSTLGTRIFHNGQVVRDIEAAPPDIAGPEFVVLNMRSGVNLVLLELPLAGIAEIANAIGSSSSDLRRAIGQLRPDLGVISGYTFGARLYPVEAADSVYAVTRLEATGAYTGSLDSPRKELRQRIFNDGASASEDVELVVESASQDRPTRAVKGGIAPGAVYDFIFGLPVNELESGNRIPLQVSLTHRDGKVEYRTDVGVEAPRRAGRSYFVMYPTSSPDGLDGYLAAYPSHLRLADSLDNYGIHLGTGYQWQAAWRAHPHMRILAQRGIQSGRLSSLPVYAHPYAPLVSGDLLIRNFQIGMSAARAYLGDWSPVWHAQGRASIPRRFEGVFSLLGGTGIVESIPGPGRPPFGALLDYSGDALPFRHKSVVESAQSKSQLRASARAHRSDISAAGYTSDVFVGDWTGSPQPFWVNDAVQLRRSIPGVVVSGGGGRAYFEELPLDAADALEPARAFGAVLPMDDPGRLLLRPELRQAHALTESLTVRAETWATIAATLGAAFPDSGIDSAWRSILLAAEDISQDNDIVADALAAYRSAARTSAPLLSEALTMIAAGVDTYTDAPTRDEGVRALLVFNSGSRARTDVVHVDIPLDQYPGLTLLDADGSTVPFAADEIFVRNQRIARARLSFVSKDVPAFGYRTYYLVPSGQPTVWQDNGGTRIGNGSIELEIDPESGSISRIYDPETGDTIIATELNTLEIFAQHDSLASEAHDLSLSGESVAFESISLRRRVAPGAERIEIAAEVLGGTITRTLTVYDGIDRIFASMAQENVETDSHVIALDFKTDIAARQAHVGEPFGGRTARVSVSESRIETTGFDHGGTALESALSWFATGGRERIVASDGRSVPIRPVRIRHADPALKPAAEAFVGAFVTRRVPASIAEYRDERLPYTDSTGYPDPLDEAERGEFLWVNLGFDLDSAMPSDALDAAPAEWAAAARDAAMSGASTSAIRTDRGTYLNLVASDERELRRAAEDLAAELADSGEIRIDANKLAGVVESKTSDSDLAVHFEGAGLVAYRADGVKWLVAKGAQGTMQELRYVIVPRDRQPAGYTNAWGAQMVTRPLDVSTSNLRIAALPPTHSFLSVAGDGVLATGLRPATMHATAGRGRESETREGVSLVVYGTHPKRARATLQSGMGMAAAGFVDAFGAQRAGLDYTAGVITFDVRPNGIDLVGFRPTAAPGRSDSVERTGVKWSRLWEHGREIGPDPQPVSLSIDSVSADEPDTVRVTVSNDLSEGTLDAKVRLETSDSWAVDTPEFTATLAPQGLMTRSVDVLRTTVNSDGYLLAAINVNGVEYVDVWPRNSTFETVAERRAGQVQVTVRNQSGQPLIGDVTIVSGPGWWPELGARNRATVQPASYAHRIEPYETQRMLFRISDGESDPDMRVRASFNGERQYVEIVLWTEN